MLLLAQTVRKDYEQGIYWQGGKLVQVPRNPLPFTDKGAFQQRST